MDSSFSDSIDSFVIPSTPMAKHIFTVEVSKHFRTTALMPFFFFLMIVVSKTLVFKFFVLASLLIPVPHPLLCLVYTLNRGGISFSSLVNVFKSKSSSPALSSIFTFLTVTLNPPGPSQPHATERRPNPFHGGAE